MNKREFLRCSICALGGIYPDPFFGIVGQEKISKFEKTDDHLWRWSREAIYYENTPRGIQCNVCPNTCVLKPGETSKCRNRIHLNGKLYSIAYGNPCAVNVDPIEKKPLFHFHPGTKAFSIATAGCNFACLNCQNWSISQSSPKETKNYNLFPDAVIQQCIVNQCESIAYTYSEPTTFYEYMYDTCQLARQAGIFNTIHSNGSIRSGPLLDLCQYMDAANIDLKSFDESTYRKLNAGSLAPILNTLKIIKKEGVWLEITNLIISGWTDSIPSIEAMCKWLVDQGMEDVPLHFSRFYPQHKLSQVPPTPLTSLQAARNTAISAGMHYVYIGNYPGANGESTHCPKCHQPVIIRKGYKILKTQIKDGLCAACNQKIEGVWN